jgi:2-iminobutanoate/2-iminopropanoate deaminase
MSYHLKILNRKSNKFSARGIGERSFLLFLLSDTQRYISYKTYEKMKKVIATTKAPGAIGPYSQAIEANGMLFISGQLPINPETGEMPEGVTAQTEQSLKNLEAILNEAGCTFDNVVKSTCYLADMSYFGEMNAVYGKYFKGDYPARAAFAVKELPKKALVEIEMIAAK